VWLGVAVAAAAVLGFLLVISQVGFPWGNRPCCIGPEACGLEQRNCAVPPPPSPTTFIAAGTVYSIPAGEFLAFEIQPSPASAIAFNGSYTSSHGVRVAIMPPSTFANFSSSPSNFSCLASVDCYGTSAAPSGTFSPGFPELIWFSATGQEEAYPWYLVQENPNATSSTEVEWTTGLVAQYFDLSV